MAQSNPMGSNFPYKNSTAINNCSLDFVQTYSLISTVNDNHVDNCLKEILTFVYYGSIVNKHIGLDKGGYPVNIFLISPRKHMLWVLIRSSSARRF